MRIFASHAGVSYVFAESYSSAYMTTVVRDVRERGRDIEGCIKQWFGFVKPNFTKYVEPQRLVAG